VEGCTVIASRRSNVAHHRRSWRWRSPRSATYRRDATESGLNRPCNALFRKPVAFSLDSSDVSNIEQHVRNRRCDDATIAEAYWHLSVTESAARSRLLTQESLAVLLHTQPNQREPTEFERLSAQEALCVKERATLLPEGQERERLSREARQLEIALHINAWISSAGLRPPR
jgi:hypothetical protein